MNERRLSDFQKVDGHRFYTDPEGYAYDGLHIRSRQNEVTVCMVSSHGSAKLVMEALENQADRDEQT